jgi:hypothetical protein
VIRLSAPLCSTDLDVLKPMAPASSARRSSAAIPKISSGVGASA